MSVSETTAVNLPLRCAPGKAAAGTDADVVKSGVDIGSGEGGADACDVVVAPVVEEGVMIVAPTGGEVLPANAPAVVVLAVAPAFPPPLMVLVGAPTGPRRGVAGALGLGLALSTTHMRCERVATSLATVPARVE